MLHHAPHEAVPSLGGKKGHGWFAAEIWDIQKMEIQRSNIVQEMTKNKDIPWYPYLGRRLKHLGYNSRRLHIIYFILYLLMRYGIAK